MPAEKTIRLVTGLVADRQANKKGASTYPTDETTTMRHFEHNLQAAGLAATRRKPFDTLAEGLILKDSREFEGPVELFLASVAEWDAHISHLVLAA